MAFIQLNRSGRLNWKAQGINVPKDGRIPLHTIAETTSEFRQEMLNRLSDAVIHRLKDSLRKDPSPNHNPMQVIDGEAYAFCYSDFFDASCH